MEPAIRHATSEEMPAFVTTMNTAFLEHVDAEKTEKVAEELRQLWDLERVWAAFDGDRLVGTFRSFATELTVPGCAQVPGNGADRRVGPRRPPPAGDPAGDGGRGARGGARSGRGGLALLYSAEYPIYGRFGYGPATEEVTWTLDALAAEFHGEPAGQRRVRPAFTRRPGTR